MPPKKTATVASAATPAIAKNITLQPWINHLVIRNELKDEALSSGLHKKIHKDASLQAENILCGPGAHVCDVLSAVLQPYMSCTWHDPSI